MEKMGEWEQRSLINELTQGRELARQLQAHLNAPSSSSSYDDDDETRQLFAQKIQASYEKALSMLNCNINIWAAVPQPSGVTIRIPESPSSRRVSPLSEDFDRCFREPELKDASKKRKTQSRWTQQVRVTPGTVLEGPLDDGFSWKKNGQKDILGYKYSRGYYRCSHRNVQGCSATKQVQRSEEDPTIFEITYIGTHTCSNVASHLMSPSGPSDENQEQGPSMAAMEPLHYNQKQSSQDLLLSFQKGLNVKTEDLVDIHHHHQACPSFPYTSSTSNVVFSSPSVIDNNGVGNLSPSNFILLATSGTNYINSTHHMKANVDFRTCDQPQVTDDQIIQAAATSATS